MEDPRYIEKSSSMKYFLNFKKWSMNEEEVSSEVKSYYLDLWKEIKFPWEAKLQEKLKEIMKLLDYLKDDAADDIDRYTTPSYCFNVKVYNDPDFEKLAEKYPLSEEELAEEWHSFLGDEFDSFVDMLDYGWIEDTTQNGRNGGWLCIEPKDYYTPGYYKDRVVEFLEYYVEAVDEIDPISQEELHKLRGSLTGKKFGLNETQSRKEKLEDIKKAEDAFKEVMDSLEKEKDDIDTVIKDLDEISDLIKASIEGLPERFEETLKRNYEG